MIAMIEFHQVWYERAACDVSASAYAQQSPINRQSVLDSDVNPVSADPGSDEEVCDAPALRLLFSSRRARLWPIKADVAQAWCSLNILATPRLTSQGLTVEHSTKPSTHGDGA
eukprot:scaffold51163_cov29-Tisochrysis_lutea.AAC.2